MSICMLGYQLRILEAPLSEDSGQDFTSYENAMWNTIITLTSAGYGELYPKSFFGRAVGVVICFWGVLIVSFFVVTVTNALEFSVPQQKSFDLLTKLDDKQQLKKKAVNVF